MLLKDNLNKLLKLAESNDKNYNALIEESIALIEADAVSITLDDYALIGDVYRAISESTQGIHNDKLSKLSDQIEEGYHKTLMHEFHGLPVYSIEAYLGGKRKGEFEKIQTSKKDMFPCAVGMFRSYGDGNCGPRAVIQALLIQGISQNKKEEVIQFIGKLVERTKDEVRSLFRTQEPDNFQNFIEQYEKITSGEAIESFFSQYFIVGRREGKPKGDVIIYFLSACLRKDMASFHHPDFGCKLKDVEPELDELGKEINLPITVPYLKSHHIFLEEYRTKEIRVKGIDYFDEFEKESYHNGISDPKFTIKIFWKRPHFDVLLFENEVNIYKKDEIGFSPTVPAISNQAALLAGAHPPAADMSINHVAGHSREKASMTTTIAEVEENTLDKHAIITSESKSSESSVTQRKQDKTEITSDSEDNKSLAAYSKLFFPALQENSITYKDTSSIAPTTLLSVIGTSLDRMNESMETTKKTESLKQGNLINVSTQNNFCGYYVLARRIINDDNFDNELLDKFNQFYQTHWKKEQLVEVLKDMHPDQADILLGLVLYDQRKLGQDGKGLYCDQLSTICKDFGYGLSLLNWTGPDLPTHVTLSDFSPPSSNNDRSIFVLFNKKTHLPIGHYYLVEPDDIKAAVDASKRDSDDESYLYIINNEGKGTETFISNIKQSVVQIDRQINPLPGVVNASLPVVTFVQDEESNNLTAPSHVLCENLSDSEQILKHKPTVIATAYGKRLEIEEDKDLGRDLVNITKPTALKDQEKRDECLAWKLAVAEAEHYASKNRFFKKSFDCFKKYLEYSFFSGEDSSFQEQADKEKATVKKLQADEIKHWNKQVLIKK